MKLHLSAIFAFALATPALAGDPVAGERAFVGQCVACHVVQDAAGVVLAGRVARVGPNLYGLAGRQAGVYEDFRFSSLLVEAGAKGLIWDEATFVAYSLNPNEFLREFTGNARARGNMAFRVRSEDDARNMWAYILSLSPAPAAPAPAN